MFNRREFLLGSIGIAAASTLMAKARIGRSRISAISDEIADSPEGALAFAKQYGLQWLELRGVPGQKANYFFMDPAGLKVHADAFAANNVRISFLNTNLLKFGLPGTEPVYRQKETPEAREKRLSREQAQFDRRMEDVRKCIKSAQILGCENVRVFAFHRVADPMSVLPRIAEILEPMTKLAANEGVKLLVENENTCNVGKCSETAALLNLLPSKAFGTNWDAMNGASLGETPFPDGYALLPKNRIWNVQIKGKTILDTPGHLDWAAIIAALDKDGFTGEIGLETHFSHDAANIERSHESMKEILRVVGGVKLSKQLIIFLAIGVVVMAALVFGIFTGTKGSHLELKGQVMKARTGALDENTSAAVVDFRISNPSNILFMVRDVKVTLEKADGQTAEGRPVPKRDLPQLLQYNKFLGSQYNDILTIKDKVPAHGQIDRMVAATFEVPQAELDKGKSLKLYIQDMDGAEFETTYKLH